MTATIPQPSTPKRTDWRTPTALFQKLHREWGFTLDAAASEADHLTPYYFTEAQNGLAQPWYGSVFVNPPYQRGGILPWLKKAYRECRELDHCRAAVLLVPAKTEQPWFRDYALRADELRFIEGRVAFWHPDEPTAAAAGFPSLLVCFRGTQRHPDYPKVTSWSYDRAACQGAA